MAGSTRSVALALMLVAGTNVVSGFPVPRSPGDGGHRTPWFMATTEAAVAIGENADAAGRLIEALTTARAVMRQVADVELLPPVRAFAANDAASLKELVPQYWQGRGVRPLAASYTGPHNAFIAVRTDMAAPQQFSLLLHEYVHLLTEAHVPDAPGWLNEGLSEFWGALVVEGGQVIVGRPPAPHLKLLRTRTWLPLDEVDAQQRGELLLDSARASMFYAQSWAMVHYLLMGRNAAPLAFAPSGQQLTSQLDAASRAYVTEGKFREITIAYTPAGATPLPARAISEAHSLSERANMVVFGERPDATLPLVRKALSLDAREPRALEVMGTYYFLRNQPDSARVWLEQALEVNPGSHSSALYLALLATSAGDRERFLLAAVTAKPDLAAAWERLWTLYGEDGRGDQARRWCDRAATLVRPGMLAEQSVRCGGEERK